MESESEEKTEWSFVAFALHSHSHSVFVTSEVVKSNFYKDLEGVMDWKKFKKRMRLRSCTEGKQNENDVKQKRDCEAATKLMTLSHSFSFCFVISLGPSSNFLEDLILLLNE
jgi:hypothetical protein